MADTRTMARIHTAGGAPAAVIAGQRVELLDRARVYACGITPYDVTHLGHAATFAWVDTLGRALRFLGVDPEVCRNVTDVDDVLDAAARRAAGGRRGALGPAGSRRRIPGRRAGHGPDGGH